MKAAKLKEAVEWRGRDNVYNIGADISVRAPHGTFGFYFDRGDGNGVGEIYAPDFNAWKSFWSSAGDNALPTEEGSIVAEAHFEFDQIHYSNSDEVIRTLRNSPKSSIEPDWDILGPGEAYVRALQAVDGLVTRHLRPSPLETGPIVLIRDGSDEAGFVTLKEAVLRATRPGDILEIRTDAPLNGFEIPNESGRALTIRAGAGYRPVVMGVISGAPAVQLTLEGLHIVGVVRGEHGGLRMENCSASLKPDMSRDYPVVAVTFGSVATVAQVRNCIFPCRVGFKAVGQPLMVIDNSILSHLSLELTAPDPYTVQMHRSIVWSPLEGLCFTIANGPANFEVEKCRFITSEAICKSRIWNGTLAGWKGSNNLYSVGSDTWYYDDASLSNLDAWRSHFHSVEEGSVSIPFDAIDGWRLLPGTPGAGTGPNGKNLGADVSGIGKTRRSE
jgi:hypothetical protein